MGAASTSTASALDALRAVLHTAHDLVADLLNDPLLGRLIQAFALLPEADREAIVRILERDATWTRIAAQTAETTGIRVRPNPHASLYMHVFDAPNEPTPYQRDVDVMRIGIERFVRIVPLLFQEGVYAQWSPAAREAARAPEPELREAVARLAREVLAMLADAERPADPR